MNESVLKTIFIDFKLTGKGCQKMNSLNKKTIEDVDVSGKRVLVRCDFNVPLKDGVITNDKRIVASLPTIQYLLSHGAKVIMCSHLGRPKGEVDPQFSLAPVAKRLSELLKIDVKMAKDVVDVYKRQIQDILGISRPTAYNLVKQGVFHSVRVGGHIRRCV